jgi:hypothetical protein
MSHSPYALFCRVLILAMDDVTEGLQLRVWREVCIVTCTLLAMYRYYAYLNYLFEGLSIARTAEAVLQRCLS